MPEPESGLLPVDVACKATHEPLSGLCERIPYSPYPPHLAPCIGPTDTDTGENCAVLNNIIRVNNHKTGIDNHPLPRQSKSSGQNRKYATFSRTLIHKGKPYAINPDIKNCSGVYTDMMHGWIDEIEWYLERYRRAYVIVFQLHHKGRFEDDNHLMTHFFKNLKYHLLKYCEAQYTKEIGYLWAMEHGETGAQHYHAGVIIDGDAVRSARKIQEKINKVWGAVSEGGSVYYPCNDFYKDGRLHKGRFEYPLDKNSSNNDHMMNLLTYRLSYFAKQKGKGERDKQVKDSGRSRNSNKLINVRGRKAA